MPKIQFKRGLESKLPVLAEGEPGFTTDSQKLYIGSENGNVQFAKSDDLTELQTDLNSQLANKANADEVNAQLAERVQGAAGKKTRIVACAIRNSGSGFHLISDAAHSPIGVSSVTNDGDSIVLNLDFTAKTVGSVPVTPDETMAKNGIIAGGSVALDKITIHAYKNYAVNGYITKSGGDVPVYSINTAISKGVSAVTQYSTNPKEMEITHDYYDLPNFPTGQIVARNGDVQPYINSYNYDKTRVKFKRSPKTLGGLISYAGAGWDTSFATGIASATWDASLTNLTVTFTEDVKNAIYNVTMKTESTLSAKVYNFTDNSVKIRFYDSAGALVTAPNTEMRIYLNASTPSGIDIIPPDGVYVFEKNGYAKMNPNDLDYPASNFWVFGIMEVD